MILKHFKWHSFKGSLEKGRVIGFHIYANTMGFVRYSFVNLRHLRLFRVSFEFFYGFRPILGYFDKFYGQLASASIVQSCMAKNKSIAPT